MTGQSTVIITRAPAMDYTHGYVSLPRGYGRPEYFEREDVQAINRAVHENLKRLDDKTGFLRSIAGRKLLLKPNLVGVYYRIGFKDEMYPESTDPRVVDAVVSFFKGYTDDITLVESSGRSMATRASFRISGLNRIGRFRRVACLPLEEQPVDRYMLPKARVMKEVYVPRIFSEVIAGEAFYVSLPKMKTNLYTEVTLGFKNAMGVLPYNLRQRNHNYRIDEKLVDLLHLLQPDLTIIDGIIGGEGNTPAPVDPVDARVIISGNNSVETDRVAIRMMGLDPSTVNLMAEADRRGFNDDRVQIIGKQVPFSFRRADRSLMSREFTAKFPGVKYFIGHSLPGSPRVDRAKKISPARVRQIENTCLGGCLAAVREGFEMYYYEGLPTDFPLAVIIGAGVTIDGKPTYFDPQGNPHSLEAIGNLAMKKLAYGSCSLPGGALADIHIAGCMPFPGSALKAIHRLTGKRIRMLSLKNRQLFTMLISALVMRRNRIRLVKQGNWVDSLPAFDKADDDTLPEIPENQQDSDFIRWPLPDCRGALRRKHIADVRRHSWGAL